jgi:serine/threonine-protein kinase
VSEQESAGAADALVGSVVRERYRILALLAEGAMGKVYAAWHVGLEQRVAFKLLRRGPKGELCAVARQRFEREARAAARIRSDHVCRVFDNGVLEDGTPFLVMEYLEGCDLADELARRGQLPIAEAVRYVRQACSALAEAHRAGIVHRDLKPANLFLQQTSDALDPGSEARRLKVLDFGISKTRTSSGSADLSLTRSAAILGSPVYMSPEQLSSSRDVDARSDVWALGVILYELLTGVRPFEQDSIPELVNAVLYRLPPPCARHGVAVPRGLEQIIERALSKGRRARYQTVAELSLALAPYERALAMPDALSDTLALREDEPADASRDEDVELSRSGVEHASLLARSRALAERRVRRRWMLAVLLTLALLPGVYFVAAPDPPAPGAQHEPGAVRRLEPQPEPVVATNGDSPTGDDWLRAHEPAAQTPVEAVEAREPAPAAAAKENAPSPATRERARHRLRPTATVPPAPPVLVPLTPDPLLEPDPLSAFGGRR